MTNKQREIEAACRKQRELFAAALFALGTKWSADGEYAMEVCGSRLISLAEAIISGDKGTR